MTDTRRSLAGSQARAAARAAARARARATAAAAAAAADAAVRMILKTAVTSAGVEVGRRGSAPAQIGRQRTLPIALAAQLAACVRGRSMDRRCRRGGFAVAVRIERHALNVCKHGAGVDPGLTRSAGGLPRTLPPGETAGTRNGSRQVLENCVRPCADAVRAGMRGAMRSQHSRMHAKITRRVILLLVLPGACLSLWHLDRSSRLVRCCNWWAGHHGSAGKGDSRWGAHFPGESPASHTVFRWHPERSVPRAARALLRMTPANLNLRHM